MSVPASDGKSGGRDRGRGGNGGGSFAGRDGRRAVAAAAVAGILAMQRRWRWHRRDQERRQRPSRAAGRMTRAQVPGYEKSGEDSILPAPRFRTVSRYSSAAGRNTIMPFGRFDKSGSAISVAGRMPGVLLRVPDTLTDFCPVIWLRPLPASARSCRRNLSVPRPIPRTRCRPPVRSCRRSPAWRCSPGTISGPVRSCNCLR